MHVKEIWRYPVKSMAGESPDRVQIERLGLADDRKVLVCDAQGRVITSRTHHGLLGLKGSLGPDGQPHIDGHPWNAPEALALVRSAIGPAAQLIYYGGSERFDVLPLLVATDGAIDAFGHDGRRLRPNIVVGGVEGLAERSCHRVLREIVQEFGGELALNCCVIHGGEIHVDDAVQLLGEHECEMNLASH